MVCIQERLQRNIFLLHHFREDTFPRPPREAVSELGTSPKAPKFPHPVYWSHFPWFSHLCTARISVHDSGSKQLSYDLVAKYLDNRASKQKSFQYRNLLQPSTPLLWAGLMSPSPGSQRGCALSFP